MPSFGLSDRGWAAAPWARSEVSFCPPVPGPGLGERSRVPRRVPRPLPALGSGRGLHSLGTHAVPEPCSQASQVPRKCPEDTESQTGLLRLLLPFGASLNTPLCLPLWLFPCWLLPGAACPLPVPVGTVPWSDVPAAGPGAGPRCGSSCVPWLGQSFIVLLLSQRLLSRAAGLTLGWLPLSGTRGASG